MPAEAAVPMSTVRELARKIAKEEIQNYARSGPLRNASISGGKGLTVTAGSRIIVQHPDGKMMMLVGAYDFDDAFDLPDGSHQPMALIARADGTLALAMYDPYPGVGGFQQFLALLDRSGNPVVSDDADSGVGLARPFLPITFYPAMLGSVPLTTSGTFGPLWRATAYKQQPRIFVSASAAMDTAGATGELRVTVNGAQVGATQTVTSAAGSWAFGPVAVDGANMSSLVISIEARRTSASGTLYAVPQIAYSMGS